MHKLKKSCTLRLYFEITHQKVSMKASQFLIHGRRNAAILALSIASLFGAQAVLAKTQKLCADCGLVTSVKCQQVKGKASAVGTVGGAVVGGLLGNQIGGGDGNTLATVAGAVGGAYAGREIEKRHKRRTVWVTTVKMSDGSYREFSQDAQPNWSKGTAVKSTQNGLVRY